MGPPQILKTHLHGLVQRLPVGDVGHDQLSPKIPVIGVLGSGPVPVRLWGDGTRRPNIKTGVFEPGWLPSEATDYGAGYCLLLL